MNLCYDTVFFTGLNNFSFDDVFNYVETLWKYISGLFDFLFALPDIIFTIFPFLSVEQVEMLVFLIVAIIVLCCYFVSK